MLTKRLLPVYLLAGAALITFSFFESRDAKFTLISGQFNPPPAKNGRFQWSTRPEKHPVSYLIPLPTGYPAKIPSIQHKFTPDSDAAVQERNRRRQSVKETFTRAWKGYKEYAWLKDELTPISGSSRNHFGGWAATLVDSLDTLWIMDLKTEFEEAVESVRDIDFTTTEEDQLNTFETTIRYLGGLLAAFDLSDGKYPVLLEKALELGDMLYAAYDTPNRMPITRWHWKTAMSGDTQKPDDSVLVAEIGSLSLEFTRLSQLTGDAKFFDAIQRISDRFEQAQSKTKLPGMWPVVVNPQAADFGTDTTFTLGAMSDSLYEYLPKQYMLLGGLSQQYCKLYKIAIDTAKKNLLFRPMTPNEDDILISGNAHVVSPTEVQLDPQGQHLVCFVGGMMGIGSRIFDRPEDLLIARKLVDGCIWAYKSMPSGIMPETFHVVLCEDTTSCEWDEKKWQTGIESRHEDFKVGEAVLVAEQIKKLGLFPGFTDIPDRRYILRPETIESIFILYRITGDESLRDSAWEIFQSIKEHTHTALGSAALSDVTHLPVQQLDSMESFWTAETLKYFFLIFSDTSLIDLDRFVFNTEAHPFKRPS